MAGPRTPDPGAERRTFAIAVLVVSTYLVMTATGGMFLLVVSLKQMAGDFGWPRAVPSLAYAFFFAGAGIGGIVMGWWYDRSGAGPVTLLGLAMIGSGAMPRQCDRLAVAALPRLRRDDGAARLRLHLRPVEHQRDALVQTPARLRGRRGHGRGGHRRHPLAADVPVLQRDGGLAGHVPVVRRLRPGHRAAGERGALAQDASARGGNSGRGGRSVDAHAGAPATPVRAIRLSTFAIQTAIGLAIVGCCVSMAMPVAHLVAHASDLGHATARAAEMLAVALLTSTVVRLVVGTLVVDRYGGLVALLVFSALQTAALVLYAVADGLLALYAVSVLFGIGYGGVNICYPVLVREHLPPAEAGRRLGVILLFGTLAMALGGWLAGWIFDSTGSYTPAFVVGAAFNVTNLVIVLGLIRRTRAGGGAPMRPVAA